MNFGLDFDPLNFSLTKSVCMYVYICICIYVGQLYSIEIALLFFHWAENFNCEHLPSWLRAGRLCIKDKLILGRVSGKNE